MPIHVMNLGTRFGEGKMAFETTRLSSRLHPDRLLLERDPLGPDRSARLPFGDQFLVRGQPILHVRSMSGSARLKHGECPLGDVLVGDMAHRPEESGLFLVGDGLLLGLVGRLG